MASVRNPIDFNDAVLKHLEFVQNIITRMARNSFLLKGWAVTLVSAIFALTANSPSTWFLAVAIFPTLAFWGLDAYYLHQERLFRRLYTRIAEDPDNAVPFSMDTSPYQRDEQGTLRIMFSVSVLPFYGAVVAVVILAIVIVQFLL